jgi:hypothetical protein
MNLRTLKAPAVAAALLFLAAAGCTDPTVAPKSTVTSANIWSDPSSYQAYLAKMYGALVLTGQRGPDGSPDIAQIDEGTSEFLRLYWYMQELPTDEAVIGWGDPGVPELNKWQWASNNTITVAMYYRVYYEVVLVNEFLRQTTASVLAGRGNVTPALKTQIQQYRAEARFLRAFAYAAGIDFFGAIPLVTEADPIGGPPPKQVARDSMYRYIVSELTALKDSLPAPGASTYGRATPMAAHMLLANLYLNAQVLNCWPAPCTGTANYAGALTEAQTVIGSGYTLNPVFRNNFTADNNLSPEFIFALLQDGSRTQTWGGMTFLVHAGCGGSMSAAAYGMDYCWGGYRIKQQAMRAFSAGDARGAFFYSTGQTDSVISIASFNHGYAAPKFTNKTSTGANGSQLTMIDADFPVFRLGEAYLIYAEAAVRTNTNVATALGYFNALRDRAFGAGVADITTPQMTLDTILAERGRELLFEGKRRTDLVRFGFFAGAGDRLWAWKGNQPGGVTMSANYNLYAIPANELALNPNIKQNTGF